jgi:type IV pilus assembly protein PilB
MDPARLGSQRPSALLPDRRGPGEVARGGGRDDGPGGVPAEDDPTELGRLLVARGVLSEERLALARAEKAATGHSLGRVLLERGLVREADLVSALAERVGLEFVDLAEYPVDPSAAGIISDSLARRYLALPIGWRGGKLLVAMADPSNVVALDDIRTISRSDVVPVVATRSALLQAIDRVHRLDSEAEDISAKAASEWEPEEDLSRLKEVVEDAPIVKLVNLVITQAVADRASDIHIEPGEHDVRVRYRIDGVLHETMRIQKTILQGVVSRLKIMADIDIAERRVPQDGRMSVTVGGKGIDVRVATLPTVFGEKVVLRILDKSTALLKLDDLGFLPETLAQFEASFRKPYGTILVTGPTGSGKSTTLYATLNQLNDDAKNIITVEDPVEYRLPGINQVQVNAKAGLTFAAALRSILRSDPDIVLVGEIRDKETATIAVEAALTGHLVLTTLHTNDAASTPTRLVEMGVEPFLVASALDCIVAQRLARRLCERCKQPYEPTPADLVAAGWDPDAPDRPGVLYRAVGCAACARTGFRGRFGIHEVLTVTEEVERLIVERGHSEDLRKVALSQGMHTLREIGRRQVASGVTTIEEILRVVA